MASPPLLNGGEFVNGDDALCFAAGKEELIYLEKRVFSNALMIKNLMCALFSLCRGGKLFTEGKKRCFILSVKHTHISRGAEAQISSPVATTVHCGAEKHRNELCHAAFSRTYVHGRKITGYEFEKRAWKQNIPLPSPLSLKKLSAIWTRIFG